MNDDMLFMGPFDKLPGSANYFNTEMVQTKEGLVEMVFARYYRSFQVYTSLDAAIEEFKKGLSFRGCAGAYYFAFAEDGKRFYLKGYPFKKK